MENASASGKLECLEYARRVEDLRLWYARIRKGNRRAEHEAFVNMLSSSPSDCRDAILKTYCRFVPPPNLRSVPLFRQFQVLEEKRPNYEERRYTKILELMRRRNEEEATSAMFG